MLIHIWRVMVGAQVTLSFRSTAPNYVEFDVVLRVKSQRQVLARFTSAQVPASGIWMFNIPQWVVDQILSAFPNFDQTLLTIETLHRHIPGSPATTWGWEYQISNVGAGRDEDGNALVVTGGWVKTAATRKPFSQASAELDMLPLDLEQ